MRRVVVTGLGLVTPLGGDVETTWKNLLASESGIATITRFDTEGQKCTIAGEVKPADHKWGFDPNKRVDGKIQRQVDPFIVYGIDAAGQALEDAGLTEMDEETKLRAGCSIGSGIGGLPGIELESVNLHERGPGRVSPHFVHGRLINLISGQVSIKYGLMGPNHAVVTACSTGAHSIGDAARMIKDDDADIMLAGGAESTINPLGVAGFAQARALNCSMNDRPTEASRPYDKDRDGFVMGEGAGVVEAVGPGVIDVKPGDRVAYAAGGPAFPPGSYAEARLFDASRLVLLPDEIDDRTAAGAPVGKQADVDARVEPRRDDVALDPGDRAAGGPGVAGDRVAEVEPVDGLGH